VFETRANHLPRAVAQFEAFIRAMDDPATGFELVLEALVDEPYPAPATSIMQALNITFPNVPRGSTGSRGSHCARATSTWRSERGGRQQIRCRLARRAAPVRARATRRGRTDDSLAMAAKLAEQHKEVEVQLQYAELLLSAGKPREPRSG